MTSTRTDVHAPASLDFDPEAYEVHGVFDLRPEWPAPEEAALRIATVNGLIAQGFRFGGRGGGCGHCGKGNVRYVALLAREDVKEMIYVGETCLDNRFSMTAGEFHSLRQSAALGRERMAKADRIAAAVEETPALAWLTYPEALTSDFVGDVAAKFRRDGRLSDRQVEVALGALVRDTEREDARQAREAAKAALAASGVQAPEGRVVVEGEVVSLKWHESQFGATLKMVVRSAEGWAVWGTVPTSIDPEKGDRVRFTATLERSTDDALFAFAKRPTKAEVLAA